jgi:transposase
VAAGCCGIPARYRRTLIHERTPQKQRVEKPGEDAQIKLSVVAADMFGVSGRQTLAALIAGQRDPKVLAQLAQGRMRSKLGDLEQGRSPGTSAPTTATCYK